MVITLFISFDYLLLHLETGGWVTNSLGYTVCSCLSVSILRVNMVQYSSSKIGTNANSPKAQSCYGHLQKQIWWSLPTDIQAVHPYYRAPDKKMVPGKYFFFIPPQKHMLWVTSLEVPHLGTSNTNNICCHGEIRKISTLFRWKKDLIWDYVLACILCPLFACLHGHTQSRTNSPNVDAFVWDNILNE